MASNDFRGIGPQAYIDQLRAIVASACAGRVAAPSDAAGLDPCITQLVQLAETLLEEREQLLTLGEAQADGVFHRVAAEYRSQIREQAAEYSKAYGAIDEALAVWRAWTHGHVIEPARPAWRPTAFVS